MTSHNSTPENMPVSSELAEPGYAGHFCAMPLPEGLTDPLDHDQLREDRAKLIGSSLTMMLTNAEGTDA